MDDEEHTMESESNELVFRELWKLNFILFEWQLLIQDPGQTKKTDLKKIWENRMYKSSK